MSLPIIDQRVAIEVGDMCAAGCCDAKGIRLDGSSAVAESIDLHLNQEVDIEAINGKIIITPIKKKKEYKLEELLSQCKPGSMELTQEDQEWLNAEPVGKEVL